MKKYILLLSLVVIAIGWTACSETSNGPGCRIKGYLSFKEYKKVYLTDNSENRIDSCEVKDGRFYLEEKGNINIMHGYSFMLQEPFKKQIIAYRIKLCDT